MKLLVRRIAKREKYTIGKLYIDGTYFCDTIEDTDRGLTQDMPLEKIKSIKVPGETAIPTGTYNVLMNVQSPKYAAKSEWKKFNNALMPRIDKVPGYSGVLIHPGNTEKDTEGCLLVGQNKVVGQVINSKDIFKKLYAILLTAKDKITITYQ